MKLNKSTSYVLTALLRGHTTAAAITKYLESTELRTVQRALSRLKQLSIVVQSGSSNDPAYAIDYANLLHLSVADDILTNEKRPGSVFNYSLLDWLEAQSEEDLIVLLRCPIMPPTGPMSARDIEHLTVELSWKSSALEGNTYSLLDTQLLLTEGIMPTNRTTFETKMIINHKDAMKFIMEHKALFTSTITFSTVEELHRIIGRNLAIESGVRKKLVHITASNYRPLSVPAKIREVADRTLAIISKQQNPYLRCLLALSLIPYIQIFEDGNKRTGRMLANALLIAGANQGFSFRSVDVRSLALAYLAFYEFNSIEALRKILDGELRS